MVRSASTRDIFAAASALRATVNRKSLLPESVSSIAAESLMLRVLAQGEHTAPFCRQFARLALLVE